MVQRSAELRHLPPSPAPPGPSKGSPALPKLLSHLKYPQIIHQELAVPERDPPQNEPTFRAIYSAAIIHTHTHIYIYLFCFMEGVRQEGNAQAGHRQGCGVRCAMYECVCGAGVCMQCVCKMGEHLHKARGAYMQGTSKAGACMHSVGACASCASMQTRDSNVHARCVCRSKVHPQSTNVCEGQTAVCRREDAGPQTPMPPLLLCDLLSL